MTAGFGWVGCDQVETDLSLPRAPSQAVGPVVARIGSTELHSSEVPGLARLANDLRKGMGLPHASLDSFENRLELAVELLVLATEAGKLPVESADWSERLLVRVYLKRLMEQHEASQATLQELEEAHQEVINAYRATRESDLYHPTRVDLTAIAIGYFPNFEAPQKDVQPVMSRAQFENLLLRIQEGGNQDLDGFLAMARRIMAGNPTVAIHEFPGIPLRSESPGNAAIAYQVLSTLEGHGAISQPIWTEGGAWIFRRGTTYPGKGENLEEVKDQLLSRVVQKRRQVAYRERMQALRSRYQITTWPRRLFNRPADRSGR